MDEKELRGKLADPEFRRQRASKAARARHSLDSYVKSIVDRAPELTVEQRARIGAALATSDPAGGMSQGERWIIGEARRIAEDVKFDIENREHSPLDLDAEIGRLGRNVSLLAELVAQLADYVESK